MKPPSARRRHLECDQRGTALTEFAILLPVMLTLYLGGFEIADAASCSRRVSTTSRSLADLVSQYAVLDPATLKTIIAASRQMMVPYDSADAKIRVSQISVDDKGKALVSWSDSSPNTGAYEKGKDLTAAMPVALLIPQSSFIYSEVSYPYTLTWAGLKPVTLTEQSIMLPRRSASVTMKAN